MGALEKIVKHLHSPKKFSKCVAMIFDLVNRKFDFFEGAALFNAFDSIVKYKQKFANPTDRINIEKLYSLLMELSSQDPDLFSE